MDTFFLIKYILLQGMQRLGMQGVAEDVQRLQVLQVLQRLQGMQRLQRLQGMQRIVIFLCVFFLSYVYFSFVSDRIPIYF